MEAYLSTLGTPSQAVFAVAGFLTTAWLIGRFALSRTDLAGPERGFLSLVLGIDLLILIATPLLWLGLLPTLALIVVYVVGFVVLGFRFCRFVFGWAERARNDKSGRIPWHLLPFLAIIVVLLPNALSYPYGWDDLVYQLAVPLRWMRANSLEVFLDDPYSAFPGVNLIANLLLVKSGGIIAPILFNHAIGLAMGLGLYGLMCARVSPWPATMLSVSFVLSLSFLMATANAYAEPMILLHVLGLLFLVDRLLAFRETASTFRNTASTRRDWVLIGILSGFAASVKLTGLIVPLAMGLLFLCLAMRRLSLLPYFLAPLMLVILLFYSRPFFATGNPLYPYCASWFTEHEATLAMSAYHHDAGQFGQAGRDVWSMAGSYFKVPFRLTFDERTNDGCFGLQCFVYLALVGFVLAKFYRDRFDLRGPAKNQTFIDPRPLYYLALAFFFYTFWFFTSQQSRFLLPGLLCVVLAGSFARDLLAGARGLASSALLLGLTLYSLQGMVLTRHVLHSWDFTVTPISFIYSAMPEDQYLHACNLIGDNRPRVLLLFEQRTLYVPSPCVIGTPYFQERLFTPLGSAVTSDDILATLRREQITHVLLAHASRDPDRRQKYKTLDRPFKEQIRALVEGKGLKTIGEVRAEEGEKRIVYELLEVQPDGLAATR